MGETMKNAFQMALNQGGSTVSIETEHGPATTMKALKHHDRGGDYFSFPELGQLCEGAVLSRAGSPERWVVDHLEHALTGDVLVKVKAYVRPAAGGCAMPNRPLAPVTINATNSQVTLQHGGQGNTQHVNISLKGELGRQIEELKKLIADSALDDLDKEEAHAEVQRIAALAEKPKTPDVLERMNGRLRSVTGIVQKSAVIAAQIAPVIEGIRRCVSGG